MVSFFPEKGDSSEYVRIVGVVSESSRENSALAK